jgi:hypothetical protein
METNKTDWEMILELGIEAGTLSIHRSSLPGESRKFVLIRDEVPVEESEEEVDLDLLYEEYPSMDTFEEAIKQMDSYPWREMMLLNVHPDYEENILSEMKIPRLPRPGS